MNITSQDFIDSNLSIKKYEKDKYGEVFTPHHLIMDMLDKLPFDVWFNPDLKWLDPANGVGNFPIVIFERLYDGLQEAIPSPDERKNHIIHNMLYMIELNPNNVEVSREVFGEDANIFCGSFLEDEWKKEFNVERFDVIVGNPPFNSNQTYSAKKGGGSSLWDKFVVKAIDKLNDDGLLLFVHPSFWRKPQSEFSRAKGMFQLMAHDNQLLYLELHNGADGKKVFNAATRYEFYVLRKTPQYCKTTVQCEKGFVHEIDMREWDFLPNHSFDQVASLLGKSEDSIIFSRNQYGSDKEWVDTSNNGFSYPLIHSTTKTRGTRILYTNTKQPPVKKLTPMFGVSKVIFGVSGIHNAIIDIDGKYGMTQQAMALGVDNMEQALEVKLALESDEFKNILNACSWSNFSINWRLFSYFRTDWINHLK